jgi:hypothetical protein
MVSSRGVDNDFTVLTLPKAVRIGTTIACD